MKKNDKLTFDYITVSLSDTNTCLFVRCYTDCYCKVVVKNGETVTQLYGLRFVCVVKAETLIRFYNRPTREPDGITTARNRGSHACAQTKRILNLSITFLI
jgi:hypothetical protein